MVKIVGRLALTAIVAAALSACDSGGSGTPDFLTHNHQHDGPHDVVSRPVLATAIPAAACVNDSAGDFPCSRVDLLGGLSFSVAASDLWGWHDEQTGVNYALLGLSVGTAFIRLAPASVPEFIAFLPTATQTSHWRDIKVLGHYALIVSEAPGHGMQVVDLRSVAALNEYTILQADLRYRQFGSAHNVAVNEDTAMAYAAGSDTCAGGLHMIDMAMPLAPKYAGCYAGDGYSHDVQCVIYSGPDTRYLGHEMCFAANEDTLTIVDVSNKSSPQLVARKPYIGARYAHQGWLTEDQRFFLLGDEADEAMYRHGTRTYIWDLSDLQNPLQNYEYTADTAAIDHNLYIFGDHVYQANYQAGVRILRHGQLAQGELNEVGYFDTVPLADKVDTKGAWSVYPFFEQGILITANTNGQFFLLQSRVEELARCADGLDNDGDGVADSADPDCESASDQTE